jgi:hypothetical protein
MKKALVAAAIAGCLASPAFAKDTKFWNLTANTITKLEISPAGLNQWGPDQTVNDPDHGVDHDERLKITGVKTGLYDVRFTDKTGRECALTDVVIREGEVFSIAEKNIGICGNK